MSSCATLEATESISVGDKSTCESMRFVTIEETAVTFASFLAAISWRYAFAMSGVNGLVSEFLQVVRYELLRARPTVWIFFLLHMRYSSCNSFTRSLVASVIVLYCDSVGLHTFLRKNNSRLASSSIFVARGMATPATDSPDLGVAVAAQAACKEAKGSGDCDTQCP